MKKTDLAKSDAKKLMNNMKAAGGQFAAAPQVDRREQRDRERALGLVPFALKLNGELVKEVQAAATARGVSVNELVAELLKRGLASA